MLITKVKDGATALVIFNVDQVNKQDYFITFSQDLMPKASETR
jgi:hypothetical protein